jgi:hypothetical protein
LGVALNGWRGFLKHFVDDRLFVFAQQQALVVERVDLALQCPH